MNQTICCIFSFLIVCAYPRNHWCDSGVLADNDTVLVFGNQNLPSKPAELTLPEETKKIKSLIRQIQAEPLRRPMFQFDIDEIETLTIQIGNKKFMMAMGMLVDPDKTFGDRFYGSSEENHKKLWDIVVSRLKSQKEVSPRGSEREKDKRKRTNSSKKYHS